MGRRRMLGRVGAGGGLPYTPPLDDYPAEIALSVRKVSSGYSDDCMLIRRSSDNSTLDIGFDSNGLFDITACQTFLSGSDGFIERWYDQSGGGGYLEQTTTADQPKIATSGTVSVDGNGIPLITFDGTNSVLRENVAIFAYIRSVFANVGYGYIFSVQEILDNTSTRGTIFDFSTAASAGTNRFASIYNRVTNNRCEMIGRRLDGDSAQIVETTSNYPSGAYLQTSISEWADSNAYIYFDGVLTATDTSWSTSGLTTNGNSNAVRLGEQGNGNFAGNLTMQEFIVYNTDESANQAAIESNISTYFSL